MKKGKVFFHPINGSGALTISWSSEPKGDAVEAKKGSGVGFFSKKGDLLCVIFDEVQSDNDHQILEFDRGHVEISVKNGRVTHTITQKKTATSLRKRRSKRKRTKHASRSS
ncbi:MAG: hypothetical protein KGJ02_01845 [Verrucomicrobiota bacterium]|nr:hypothetical protein [Verrucomicrobiota bacterium]